jgi:hypothetical protein
VGRTALPFVQEMNLTLASLATHLATMHFTSGFNCCGRAYKNASWMILSFHEHISSCAQFILYITLAAIHFIRHLGYNCNVECEVHVS